MDCAPSSNRAWVRWGYYVLSDNFMGALVILRDRMTYTIPVALRSFQGQAQTDYGAIMVGACIAVLPLVVVFLFMSKQLIAGLTYGAVKG